MSSKARRKVRWRGGPVPKKKDIAPERGLIPERLQGLHNRINDYETYFQSLEGKGGKPDKPDEPGEPGEKKGLDHQGTTAYINLVKLVTSLKEAAAQDEGAKEPGAISDAAKRIFKEEYGVDIG